MATDPVLYADLYILARAIWPDAARLSDSALAMYIGAAEIQCAAYAPPVTVSDPFDGTYDGGTFEDEEPRQVLPPNYQLAVVYQARNIYNAGKASATGSGDFDGSGYNVTAYPLDWHVKQLLRPEVLGGIA